ncbi:hypothetical protein ACFOMD_17220 [Sphingoaurantiacus capsulatus]|uniref:Uncharacterized protein n=1 Tax=Sphingoaurantiacus capsulatus TaxID=1771310 RepID=A0ABV7XGC0_9SPHN
MPRRQPKDLIRHRTVHATLTNHEIEREPATPEALRAHPALTRFIAWVADKPPDFHSPTRRRTVRDAWRLSRKH